MTEIEALLRWTMTSETDKDITVIIDYRVFQGKVQYLVRRKSEPLDKWEDSSSIYASNLILRFWEGKNPQIKPNLLVEDSITHVIPNQLDKSSIDQKEITPMPTVRFLKSFTSDQSINFLVIEPNEAQVKTLTISEVKSKYPLELIEYFEKSLLDSSI